MGDYKFLGGLSWLFALEGYGRSRSWPYRFYMLGICCWNLLVFLDASYSAYLVMPDKERAIDGLHSALIAFFGLWGLATAVLTRGALDRCKEVVEAGFYRYPGEEPDPVAAALVDGVGKMVRRSGHRFFWMMSVGALGSMIFVPITQFLLVTQEQYEQTVDFANPYLPHYIYLPWSTRSFIGYASGFLIHLLIFTYTYGIAIVMNEIYTDCVMHLIIQLKILNRSISNLRERALKLYTSMHGQHPTDEWSSAFQGCLHDCLVSNIKHHQVIIRFTKIVHAFIGSIFLLLVVAAANIFAAIFYLIMQGPRVNYLISYLVQLFSEQSYTYYTCYFGERVLEESGKLFESLYFINWPGTETKFTRTLHIFRIFTRHPIRLKSHLLDFTASLESYAVFMSAMYKIMNLMRQSDK